MFISIYIFPLILGYVFLPFLFLPRYIYPLFIKNEKQLKKINNLVPLLLPLVVFIANFFLGWEWVRMDGWEGYSQSMFSQSAVLGKLAYTAMLGGLLTVLFFGILGAVSIPYYIFNLTRGFWKKRVGLFQKFDAGIGILTLFVFILPLSLIYILIGDEFDSPAASRYFKLNAAIKNTCIVDAKREHCPHTLEELSYIEPKEFAEVSQRAQMIYQYYPETNQYTLIVRYSPKRAAIFDPRLSKMSRDALDFGEYKVETTGKDRLANPPAFNGPWDQIKEWDK